MTCMRLTRREWTILLGTAPLAAGIPQTPSAQPPMVRPQGLDKALEDVRHNSERLSTLEVPMDVEPAFSFKA